MTGGPVVAGIFLKMVYPRLRPLLAAGLRPPLAVVSDSALAGLCGLRSGSEV